MGENAKPIHNDYRLMTPQPSEKVDCCPCCGSVALVWEYSESAEAVVQRVVMCEQQDSIGPRDALVYSGCLLAMPPDDFYRGTGRSAVAYWNGYAKALSTLRRKNDWQMHSALREERA